MSRTNRTYTAQPHHFFANERYAKNVNNDGASVPPRHGKAVSGGYAYVWKGYAECAWNRGKAWFKQKRSKLMRRERKAETHNIINEEP